MSATSPGAAPAPSDPPGSAAPSASRVGHGPHPVARPPVGGEHHDLAQVGEPALLPRRPARRDLVQHPELVEAAEAGHGDQELALGLREDVAQLLGAVEVVERDRHGPGPGDRELQRDELEVVGHHETDPVPGPHAEGDEAVGEAARPGRGLGVGDGALVGDDERTLADLVGDVLQPLVQRHRRPGREPPPQLGPSLLETRTHAATTPALVFNLQKNTEPEWPGPRPDP